MKLSDLPTFDLTKQVVSGSRKAPRATKRKKRPLTEKEIMDKALELLKEVNNG